MIYVNEIIKMIEQKGFVKNADAQAIMGKSASTAKRLLAKMVETQMISLEGVGRGKKYVKYEK